MFNFTKKDIRKFKVLGILSLMLVFIVLSVYGVRYYFSSSIMNNWESISGDKKNEIHANCLDLFYSYQNQVSQFSYKLSKDRKLSAAFTNQNSRKTYEALYEEENLKDFNVELYNGRLELFLFSGRQINPDVLELRKALAGERFSAIKEIGIYTYVVVFDPLRNDLGIIEGVLVTSGLLDINYEIQGRFFRNTGIKRLIYDRYHIDVEFEFANLPSNSSKLDTAAGEFSSIDLKNINDQVIGRIIIPNLDQSSYLLNVIGKFNNLIGFLLFVLNVVLIYWVIAAVSKTDYIFLKILLTAGALISSRYIWIAMNFPGQLLTEMGSEIFSPVHYASGIGYGMAKSLGELLITSLVILFISLYSLILIIRFYKDESNKKHKMWVIVAVSSAAAVISTLVINYYGVIIQSLIFDSTIKFIDKTDIFSLNQPELVTVRMIILFFSSALILVQVACALTATKFLNPHLIYNKFTRKNSSLIFFMLLILVNLVIEFMPMQIELALKLNLRVLILVLSGLFTLYLQRQFPIVREYRFVNVVNFSLVLLACAIFVPAILLNKITSLENRYLEKAAKEISQQSSDKISFLISSTLEDISDDTQIESDLKDKNKVSKLAFNIWAKSKFYEEDLNSAVFVLDTAKKLVSDFNINPSELLSDSVVSFSLKNIDNKRDEEAVSESTETDEEPETLDFSTVMNSMQLEASGVIQNKDLKFYSAIMPLEKPDLKNSKFNKIIGYIIIAAGYDAKNFLTQSNLGIFNNFTRDNILNKLTSNPVITEFSESELVGSSNKDISKSLVKSLDAFRESVKDKIDKSSLRYDEFENEFFKSYYVLTTIKNANSVNTEKIYIVSVKVNDFSLNTFFFFRYLLFIVLIYILILTFYLIYKGFTYLLDTESVKFMKFGFREKLFVSFMLASVIPIVILAIYTREFVNEKNEDSSKNQLISDLRIVDQYVKNKLSAESLKSDRNPKKESGGTFVNLFDKGFTESDKNFNFYLKTRLAATTSEQLYKSDLLDTRISGNAYYNIVLLKKDYYSENQKIGDDFTFIVGYKPIYDSYNNLLGIISTQTVFKQSEINQELTESLVYILGPYFAAVILLVFIVNFLSYRISNPILKLQKATEQLSKGNIDIQVKSNSKDEIGELVKSFNRMIRELQRSRFELKKAEREGAWRDIARQVAHEIKNPLTPMKLAMQHLYYAYTHGSNDFKSIIQTTNKLIIEQVETLNRIATEFSNFAKLPSRNYELLNMNELLSDVVKLMNTNNSISLKLVEKGSNEMVMADKDEIKRALINIIKNSMQAIDEKESLNGNGKICIESSNVNGYYKITIADNGVGMDDETLNKLFEPYFSTKSSGMGLGLVITKKILDDMNAVISVKSNIETGTEVEIKFKIVEHSA